MVPGYLLVTRLEMLDTIAALVVPHAAPQTLCCEMEDRSTEWVQVPFAQLAKRPANDPPRFEFSCSAPVACTAPKETCKTVGTVRSSGQ